MNIKYQLRLAIVLWMVRTVACAAVNDSFANAIILEGRTASSTSSFLNASSEVGEGRITTMARGQSLWWAWKAPADGLVHLDLEGTSLSLYTVLGVFLGEQVGNLSRVEYNINSHAWAGSHVDFVAKAGTTYRFAGDLYSEEYRSDEVRLSLEMEDLPPVALRPANDDFVRASILSGQTASDVVNNEYATGENGQSSVIGGAAAKTVWWSWTAPGDGFVQIDTHGSTTVSGAEMDTILGVFRSLDASAEEYNDDSGSRLTSEVNVAVVRGVRYYIVVATASGTASGTVRLGLSLRSSYPAPVWSARTLDDLPIESKEYAGKVLVLNFWATWCVPCLQEIPELITLHERYKDRGFSVIGVSVDSPIDGKSPLALVGGFAAKRGITYPIALDRPWGTLELGFGAAHAIPASYVVDRQGNIVAKLVGSYPVGWNLSRFEKVVVPLLGPGASSQTLQFRRSADGRFELSWDADSSARLEVRTNLISAWEAAKLTPTIRDSRKVVFPTPSGTARYFRLSPQ